MKLKVLCATTERTVVSVVVTWLSEEISGPEVSTPDYSVIRHRHDGDIAIHVQNIRSLQRFVPIAAFTFQNFKVGNLLRMRRNTCDAWYDIRWPLKSCSVSS